MISDYLFNVKKLENLNFYEIFFFISALWMISELIFAVVNDEISEIFFSFCCPSISNNRKRMTKESKN